MRELKDSSGAGQGRRRFWRIAASGRRRAYWTPIVVLVLGALSIGVLMWTNRVSEQQTIQDLLVDDAIRRLAVSAATSHVWLEELLSGDPSINLDEVSLDLDRSLELVRQILDGSPPAEPRGQIMEPLEDPGLRRQAERVRRGLLVLREAMLERYRRGAGIGSELDQSFDELFREVLRNSEELSQALSESTARSHAGAHRRIDLVIGAWLLIVTGAVSGLWTREQRRRQTEAVLRQREEELRQAQKMEAVGRLAGGIAHDINNYLGAIRGYCEVAKMNSRGDEAQVERLDAAMETATEASGLIEQLLAFSRKRPVRTEVIELNRGVAKTEHMIRRLIGDDISLETRFQKGVWSVEVDPSHIDQIVVNLAVNSRDAMPRGGEIVLATRNMVKGPEGGGEPAALPPGRYAVLSVHDTGTGIAPEIQEKIFEPFFTTKSETGSSGLGLATVYGLVMQYGGHVEVDSRPGRGTTFEIYLPASDKAAVARRAPAETETSIHSAPAKVLLVEDNQRMRASTRSLLQTLGHEVLVAEDGQEALRLLAADDGPLDLVISDVVMPGLSGPDLLERIRELKGDLPCIFVSGYADSVLLGHGLDDEGSDYLPKPFTARDLSRKIGEMLNADGAAPRPPAPPG